MNGFICQWIGQPKTNEHISGKIPHAMTKSEETDIPNRLITTGKIELQ